MWLIAGFRIPLIVFPAFVVAGVVVGAVLLDGEPPGNTGPRTTDAAPVRSWGPMLEEQRAATEARDRKFVFAAWERGRMFLIKSCEDMRRRNASMPMLPRCQAILYPDAEQLAALQLPDREERQRQSWLAFCRQAQDIDPRYIWLDCAWRLYETPLQPGEQRWQVRWRDWNNVACHMTRDINPAMLTPFCKELLDGHPDLNPDPLGVYYR